MKINTKKIVCSMYIFYELSNLHLVVISTFAACLLSIPPIPRVLGLASDHGGL